MALIYETSHFILESHDQPEVDRLDGGHIKISPKVPVVDRTQLTPQQAIELMRLTIIAGRALVAGMKRQGVDIGRINYQDNGNWKPQLHIHLYGRARAATQQPFGDPIVPGHKESYSALNQQDIDAIRAEIEQLFLQPEFQDKQWFL